MLTKIINWVRQLIKDQLKSDGYVAFDFNGDNIFTLPEPFVVESSIKVYKNGTEIDDTNWEFDSNTNQVIVDFVNSGEDFEAEDLVEIKFNYYAKYSDTEIQGFVESSFLYFTEFRYAKTFYINDQNQIVAEDDISPTTKEGHLIALVTAILINPDNVRISLPDITRTGSQDKSKKDQIAETISRFLRFTGNISFLED